MQTVGSAWSQFQCGCVKLRWRSCFDTEISTICHRFVAQSVLDGGVTERTLAKSNQNIPQPARPLRIALVTETYPPEINGVASTVAQLVAGLLLEGHFVEVTRPRQPKVDGVSKNGPSPRTGGMGMAIDHSGPASSLFRTTHLRDSHSTVSRTKTGASGRRSVGTGLEGATAGHRAHRYRGPAGMVGVACGTSIGSSRGFRVPDQLPCLQCPLRYRAFPPLGSGLLAPFS